MGLTFKPVDSEQSRLLSIMWWASFRQLKALKRKLEVPWRGRGSSSRLKHRNFAWASSLQTQDYKSNSCWKFKPASLYTHTCTPPPTHPHPHPTSTHTHPHTHTHTHTHPYWFCFSGEPWYRSHLTYLSKFSGMMWFTFQKSLLLQGARTESWQREESRETRKAVLVL